MNTPQYTTNTSRSLAYREYRERLAHEATYEQQVRMAEAQQQRINDALARTAAEFPHLAGDQIFA
jgi:hypothetical protein